MSRYIFKSKIGVHVNVQFICTYIIVECRVHIISYVIFGSNFQSQ